MQRDVEVLSESGSAGRSCGFATSRQILKRGLLGKDAPGLYEALPVSDQALTRERYLRLVEAVPHGIAAEVFEGCTPTTEARARLWFWLRVMPECRS